MMTQAGLSEQYWAEAVATAAYLRNRVVTRSLKKTISYEKWYGKRPDLSVWQYVLCLQTGKES